MEATLLKLNCDKSKAILDWEQVWDFPTTIEKTANWYKSFYAKEDMNGVSLGQVVSYCEQWSKH